MVRHIICCPRKFPDRVFVLDIMLNIVHSALSSLLSDEEACLEVTGVTYKQPYSRHNIVVVDRIAAVFKVTKKSSKTYI